MEDEYFQTGRRPSSQHFQSFQRVSQPSLPTNFTTNNQLGRITDGAAQESTFEHYRNVLSGGIGGVGMMMLPSGLQRPVQGTCRPPVEPQPFLSLDHSTNNLSIEFNPSTSENLTMQDCENIIPITRGELDTTMFSSELQQSLFWHSVAPHMGPPSMNAMCSEQGPSFLMIQRRPPADNHSRCPPKVLQRAARKRSPKAPTMSAQKWVPAEDRIGQLFIKEGRTYKEVMDTINKEFGFTATERQYKAKIRQMKRKRNVEASYRAAIIRHIQYRKHTLGKLTKHVRVHGHKKSKAMVQRWMKEYPTSNWPTHCPSPSPLPSQISLRTRSRLASPAPSGLTVSNKPIQRTESVITSPPLNSPIARLLSHAHGPNTIIKSEQCGAILNDFQHILSASIDIPQCPMHDIWSPVVENDLVNVRNRMNLTREIRLGKEFPELSLLKLSPNYRVIQGSCNMCATRRTPYGRVVAIFRHFQPSSEHDSVEKTPPTQTSIAAQITLQPSGSYTPRFRIVLDLDPRLNPSATITYQAMIPNNSEIFSIMRHGRLEDLMRVLENKTASLTDRDEEGKSLLNYAKRFSRADLVRFLLKNNFDPDAIELNPAIGLLVPLSQMREWLASDFEFVDKDKFYDASECYRLMLEAGADFGLESYGLSGFDFVLNYECSASLKQVVRHGGSFVHPDILVLERPLSGPENECSPLIELADCSGYGYSHSIHIIEKAIILLKWGVEISCRDSEGNTVLHRVLRGVRITRSYDRRPDKEPGELLKVFIAAGADAYALNNAGRSASRTARNFGREKEWAEGLEFCGFDTQELVNQTLPKHKPYIGPRQTSKLTFEEYYRTWDENKWAEKMGRLEEVESEGEKEYCCNNRYEDTSDEDEWCYEHESEDEERLEGQLKCCCTPDATAVVSRNLDGDNNDPIDKVIDDHYGLGHEFYAENGDEIEDNILMDQPDHMSSIDTANTFEGMDHDCNNVLMIATPRHFDPMLNEEIGSTTGSWRYDAMDHRRNQEETSMAEGNFIEMDATFEAAFQTDFDTIMASDQG